MPPGAGRLARAGAGVAAAGLVFLASAGLARANPGVPSLYYVPNAALADDNSVGAPGVQKSVSFGWQEVTLDADTTTAFYGLCAQDLSGPLTCSAAAASGDTRFAASASVALTDGHAYDVYVYVHEDYRSSSFPFPTGTRMVYGPASRTVADFVAPGTGTLSINAGARYTNRLTVSVGVSGGSDGGSGVGSAQIGTDSSLPCSTSGVLPTCPFPLANGAGSRSVDLGGGDGLKFIWGRVRDRADHPATSLSLFGNPTPGNPSPTMSATITVDTTPPLPVLASATLAGVAGQPVAFDASASTDSGSGVNPTGFDWTFGDGVSATSAAASVTHVYPGPGSYTGRVVVHDRAGHNGAPADTNLASLAFTVTVQAAPVAPPSAPPPAAGGTPPPVTAPPTTPPSTPPAPTPAPAPGPPAPRGGPASLLQAVTVNGRPTSGHAFTVDVRSAAAGVIVAVLRNRAGHVVQRLSHRHRAGLVHLGLRGHRAGRYTLTVSLGTARKTIKLRIRS